MYRAIWPRDHSSFSVMSLGRKRLLLPDATPVGGVVVFLSDRQPTGGHDQLLSALCAAGLATLRVRLSDRTAEAVSSSIRFLSRKCGENSHRVAVLVETDAASAAVLGARTESCVRSFVLLSGRLNKKAVETLVEWRNNAVLCLVSSEDRNALRDMTTVYLESDRSNSDIRVFEGLGRGLAMIEAWSEQFPEREPLAQFIANWIRNELISVGRAREVSFLSEDGWRIFGNLLLPDPSAKKVPGIVLLHSGRSDRYVFANLERLLVRAGLAVLNIDWRGRGKSVNKGRYFDLSQEERANGWLDARAAINYLASQDVVDAQRIGLVGIVHGAEHAVRCSIGDSRVKALALLTGYVPISEAERKLLTGGHVHVMYVSCRGHRVVTKAMHELYEATTDKLARLLIYDGGAIGYQLFELHPQLEPTIVQWLKQGLG